MVILVADDFTQTCTTTLALRHMVRPFGSVPLSEQAGPMSDILNDLQAKLKELNKLKSAAAGVTNGADDATPAPPAITQA